MPVHKYRDVACMPDRSWRSPGDPALAQAIRHVWDFAQRTTQPRFPPGLYKHRSVEAAMAQREAWDAANFAAFLARRCDSDKA
jgi:hypothetical protein